MGKWERRGSGGRVREWGKGKGREKGRGREWRMKEGDGGKEMGNEGCGKGKSDGDWWEQGQG